jgi:hypothetical protein
MDHQHDGQHHGPHDKCRYVQFGVELVIDFIIMFLVMYTMIATIGHLYLNINNFYMTLMMVAPMALVMLISMRSMFPKKNLNMMIGTVAVLVFSLSFIAMRTQAAVGDVQFLRSMIPHHSGAILMCEEASIKDPEIATLCREIIIGQQKEISQMQAILQRLE